MPQAAPARQPGSAEHRERAGERDTEFQRISDPDREPADCPHDEVKLSERVDEHLSRDAVHDKQGSPNVSAITETIAARGAHFIQASTCSLPAIDRKLP